MEQQQEMPQKFMAEIVRLYSKLKEMGVTQTDIVAETTQEIINGKLVYTDTLKAGKTVTAQATRIDNRSLEQIKQAAVAEKTLIDQQAAEVKAKVDEVLAIVEPEVAKK